MSYPNQLFTISQKQKCEKDFLQISNKAWINAGKRLSKSALLMWQWLISNSSAYRNELSRSAFINEFDCNERTYERSWRELKEKGYAVLKEGSKNTYLILEEPISINPLQTEGDNNPDIFVGIEESENNPDKNVAYPRQKCRLSPTKMSPIPDKNVERNREHINIETDKERSLHSSASQSNEVRSTPKPPKGASPRVEEKVREDLIEITMAELREIAQQNCCGISCFNHKEGYFTVNDVHYKAVDYKAV